MPRLPDLRSPYRHRPVEETRQQTHAPFGRAGIFNVRTPRFWHKLFRLILVCPYLAELVPFLFGAETYPRALLNTFLSKGYGHVLLPPSHLLLLSTIYEGLAIPREMFQRRAPGWDRQSLLSNFDSSL